MFQQNRTEDHTMKDMVSLRLRLVTMDTHSWPTVNINHPHRYARLRYLQTNILLYLPPSLQHLWT